MKDETRQFGRREFNRKTALAVLSGVAITITGCGGYDSAPGGPTAPPPPPGTDRVGAISANHGHAARITGAQLTSGNTLMLDIQGESNHRHTVELSAADVEQIRNGLQVSKESSTGQAHRHTVTFN